MGLFGLTLAKNAGDYAHRAAESEHRVWDVRNEANAALRVFRPYALTSDHARGVCWIAARVLCALGDIDKREIAKVSGETGELT